MKSSVFLAASVVFAVSAAFASPTITVNRVQQRYPWNGMVDVDYTVSGYEGGDIVDDYFVRFRVDYVENETAKTFVPTNFLVYAAPDLPRAAGTYRVTWDAKADGCLFLATNATFTADLVSEVVEQSEAKYMIVDLSAGNVNDAVYPVRYVRDDIPTSCFNKDLYKTTKLVMKKVPAGDFWMGTGTTEGVNNWGNVSDREGVSRHRVRLTKDFFLGIFEATARQAQLVAGTALAKENQTSPKHGQDWRTSLQIANTSYFTNLSNRAQFRGNPVTGFTLPTESQWEYACRAGTLVTYNFGVNFTGQSAALNAQLGRYCQCNQTSQYGPSVVTDGQGHANVGQFPPNNWGFYDMAGNVAEWCLDWQADYPAGTMESPAMDPTGPAERPSDSTIHCIRGGCSDSGWNCLASCKRQAVPSAPSGGNSYRNGFRWALTCE